MIRVAIVEDEDLYVEQLAGYLKDYQKETGTELAVTVYRDGDEILAHYKSEFDIILMDIQMKFVDGMTAAKEIRQMDREVVILFITNMTQYAIEGYKVDALDYILKPISYFAFRQRFHRAVERIRGKSSHYIILQVKGGVMRMDMADVYYVESVGHNLIYHTGTEETTTAGTIKAAEETLAPYSFSRVNKGVLVNLAHVDGIKEKCAVVKGELIPISRSRQNEFMQELTRFWNGS